MRIATLLPSATEIVCAIGAGSALVGRSHECDFPRPDVDDVPVVTGSRALGFSSTDIDASVREAMDKAVAIYHVDENALRSASPDIVVTQDLCEVCAVPASAVEAAVCALADQQVETLRLAPRRLNDVYDDIQRIGTACGLVENAQRCIDGLRDRITSLENTTASVSARPRVLTVEWLDPLMIGGLWTPELVRAAGGDALEAEVGELSRTLDREQIAALDPDVIVFKPCGYTLDHSIREIDLLNDLAPPGLRCHDAGQVFVTDGNAYFNRSGPRLVDSAELLAGLLHPALFPEFLQQFEPAVCRLTRTGLVTVC